MTEEKQPDDLGPPEEDQQEQEETDEMALLKEQKDEALREKEQFRAMAQRAQADLVNYKKRAADEQEETRRTANSQLILKILSVLDDLNRALDMVPEDAVAPRWLEGLHLVKRNLESILDSEGVSRIEAAEGWPFEPREHEAVFYEESPGNDEGTVVRVVRDGYKLHDRVLRAAQVSVAKPPEQNSESETTRQEAE